VRRVNRRLSLVLSVAVVAGLTAGCSTFSDNGNVARVGDATLTDDDFQAQLTELGAPSDQLLPADDVRAQITTWIREQVAADESVGVDADEAAALYDAGIESGGSTCISAIVVETEDTANRVADELTAGSEFAELLAAENIDPNLRDAGGDIGCITSDQLAQGPAEDEFVQAAAGLSADDPIAFFPLFDAEGNESAWVVLRFRPFAELSAAEADTVTAAIDSAARLADADVFVDPRYGTFDATTGQVVALG
jgi:hypothetical protein